MTTFLCTGYADDSGRVVPMTILVSTAGTAPDVHQVLAEIPGRPELVWLEALTEVKPGEPVVMPAEGLRWVADGRGDAA